MAFIGKTPTPVPLTSGDIPDLPATKITSGTFPALNASNLTNLDATDLSGTLPALNGSALTNVSAGKVLQIKYAYHTGAHSTTSTAYSSIISLNITPTKTSSVIKLIFTGRSYTAVTNREHYQRFYRDSTTLEQYAGQYTTSGATAQREIFEFFDDGHNTTSQITYSFQHRSGNSGDSMSFSPNGASDGGVYLTVMEIDS